MFKGNLVYLGFLIICLASLSSCSDNDSKNNEEISDTRLYGMTHFYGEKSYDSFSGKWIFSSEQTWLLLNDGWALKNPKDPILNVDFGDLRQSDPDRWVKWNDNKKFENITIFKPSPKNARYEMTVTLYSVNGTPVSSTVSTRNFSLKMDGSFETSVFTLAGNSVTSSENLSGTYSIDGHTITLNFENGDINTFIFATDGIKNMILGRDFYYN